jgi:hypothetical protein
MVPYQYLKKEWIVSLTARRVYRAAAIVSLTLYPLLLGLIYNGRFPILKQLLFIAVLATAINGVGMEFYLFRFDESEAWKQVLWFCALIFIPIGPALYCLLVYSRSQAVRTACSSADAVLGGAKHL